MTLMAFSLSAPLAYTGPWPSFSSTPPFAYVCLLPSMILCTPYQQFFLLLTLLATFHACRSVSEGTAA